MMKRKRCKAGDIVEEREGESTREKDIVRKQEKKDEKEGEI